jgi:hypothetical protein
MPKCPTDAHERMVRMLTTPALWPTWPFLPMVRRSGEKLELGLVFDARGAAGLTGYRATVFHCSLFTLPARFEEFLNLPREVFDSTDELVASGWEVD